MMISINGRLTEDSEAVVSAYDHGFLYGLGLFETFRTYKGHPFLLEEHLARLNRSCEVLGIRYAAESSEVRKQIDTLLEVNGLEDAYIRYSVSAGSHGLGLTASSYEEPVVVIYMKQLAIMDAWYESGRPVQILRTIRPIPETKWRLKSFQYMNGWMAKQELMQYSWASQAEGVQLNERGELTEGIVSNMFFVKDNILYTPSLESGALPGITREFVLRAARQLGIAAKEGVYRTEHLLAADEIFLTNSVQEIVPVSEVYQPDGSCTPVKVKVPGPVTERLMRHYRFACGGNSR